MKAAKEELLEEVHEKYPCVKCGRNEETCMFRECPAYMIWLTRAWRRVTRRLKPRRKG